MNLNRKCTASPCLTSAREEDGDDDDDDDKGSKYLPGNVFILI